MLQWIFLHRHVVYIHTALCRLVQARNQLYESRFCCTSLPDNSNRLSGFQIQTNVRKHIFLRVFAVLKKYMVETDRALFHADRTCLFLRDLHLFVQNLENSGSARHRTGQHHKNVRQHHQGV